MSVNLVCVNTLMTVSMPNPPARGPSKPAGSPPHPQGLQGPHLNLSQTSAQRHTTYFLLNNKAVNQGLQGSHLNLSQTSAQRHRRYFLLNNRAVKQSYCCSLKSAQVVGDTIPA